MKLTVPITKPLGPFSVTSVNLISSSAVVPLDVPGLESPGVPLRIGVGVLSLVSKTTSNLIRGPGP